MFLRTRHMLYPLLSLLSSGLLLNASPALAMGWTETIESTHITTEEPSRFPQRLATLNYMGLFPTTMQLERQQDQYQITVTANIPFRKIVLRSKGTLINKQFKPELFQDIRNDQLYAQSIFDYEKQEIRQGKVKDTPTITPMQGQALDPFSLAWQLSLNHGVMTAPFQLATGKGSIKIHTPDAISTEQVIRATGSDSIEMAIQLITLPGEKNSQYGLAMDIGYLPAIFGFEGYALTIEQINIDGQKIDTMAKINPN